MIKVAFILVGATKGRNDAQQDLRTLQELQEVQVGRDRGIDKRRVFRSLMDLYSSLKSLRSVVEFGPLLADYLDSLLTKRMYVSGLSTALRSSA